MPSPIEIRGAVPQDAPWIVAFNQALASETEGKTLDPGRIGPGVDALLADPTKGRYFVGVAAGRIVGQLMITYEWSDWRNGMFWWIQSVYVSRDHRRQGVFRALFSHVQASARGAAGVCGLRLYMEHANANARATYFQLGLRPAGYEVLELDFLNSNIIPAHP